MEKKSRNCRTFNRVQEDEAPCSIATTIERYESMLTPAILPLLLCVSVKSIYAWVKQGTLPAVILGASIRFCPVTTAQWLRDRSA
jgi:predicted DNA-binding transcriptional regulator AlpA